MELREFAERVLFTTVLEEKLQCPPGITDECPGSAIRTPAAPGRPSDLHFKPVGEPSPGSGFPGAHRLESLEERGRLLHFFANHELLATELMALVLLRFPEAPTAFRRGVLQTLKDEQRHTRLYLERLQACGIPFGVLPVSGYFWRAISGMTSPVDYVAGLSLTFEQANLDFSRHFAREFAAVDDAATAGLLDRIYRDEIRHVAYGLEWFRRWKEPGSTDWEAFERHLQFPLSPRRAKGPDFNREGRRAAGLDEDFIERLAVFARSRGRTPTVFLFNPLSEGTLAQGPAFAPIAHQRQLVADLENLPQFLGREDDIVLVRRRPAAEFLDGLQQSGFPLPEFVEIDEQGCRPSAELERRKLGRLCPWAWGPDSLQRLAPLIPRVTGERRTAEELFHPGIAELYSKAWSVDRLRAILAEVREPWLCPAATLGRVANTLGEALDAIAAIRAQGEPRVVVKQAIGLAGHNALRLWEPEVLETQRRWIAQALERRSTLVVEPWLDRLVDFSVQIEVTPDGVRLVGFAGLITDHRGQYRGNWAGPHPDRCPPEVLRSLAVAPRDLALRLLDFYQGPVFRHLACGFRRAGYVGPAGIDAFVYRDTSGQPRLKPIVEVNPRYTMGRLTLELLRHTTPGSHGLFEIVPRTRIRQAGLDGFAAYARELAERSPVRRQGSPVPRLHEGAICLNDPRTAQAVLAVFHVRRRPNLPEASRPPGG